MRNLEQLAVRVKILQPTDSIGKAAEAVRCSSVGAVPVARDGMLCGLLTADILAEYLVHGSPERVKDETVACLPLERAVVLPESLPAAEALQFFRENELERAPVIDRAGGLVGIVSTAELVSAVCGRVPPPIIGGMATPFGVYLTGGGVRGGVGDLALMTTGMYMAALQLAALVLTHLIADPGGWAYSWPLLSDWLRSGKAPWFGDVLWPLLFALFFRLSWITGYHAAEHQVVHAIEAGDDLRPEVVRQKPRVHPRCGTNLVTAVLLMSGLISIKLGGSELGVILPMFLTFILWRRMGAMLQQYVTTRPANLKQLESGIRAGEELLERYQQKGEAAQSLPRRIWNMGLLQVLGGSLIVGGICYLLQHVPLLAPAVKNYLP